MTDILQILEEIKMILFNIKDDTDLRIKMKETVRIFAGFCDKIPGLSYPDISTDRLQDAAYRNGCPKSSARVSIGIFLPTASISSGLLLLIAAV